MPLGPSVFSPNVTLISASLGREGGPHSGTGLALSTFCSKTFSDTQESLGLLYKHSQEVQGDPRAQRSQLETSCLILQADGSA